MLELFAKKAISREDLSPFLGSWLDRESLECMFSTNQSKTWTTTHLNTCGWYLECDPKFTAALEIELQQCVQAMDVVDVLLDEYAGLEQLAKDKAILKHQEEDRKEKEKLIADIEKVATKKAEKKLKADRRATEKEAQKSKGKN